MSNNKDFILPTLKIISKTSSKNTGSNDILTMLKTLALSSDCIPKFSARFDDNKIDYDDINDQDVENISKTTRSEEEILYVDQLLYLILRARSCKRFYSKNLKH